MVVTKENDSKKDLKESIGMVVVLIIVIYLISAGQYKSAFYGIIIAFGWIIARAIHKNKKIHDYINGIVDHFKKK